MNCRKVDDGCLNWSHNQYGKRRSPRGSANVRHGDTFQRWKTETGPLWVHGNVLILLYYSLLGLRSYFIAGSESLSFVLLFPLFLLNDWRLSAPRLSKTWKSHARLDWHRLSSFISTSKTSKKNACGLLSSLLVQLAAQWSLFRILSALYSDMTLVPPATEKSSENRLRIC